ncbi:MAG TPA: DNA repair protein RadC [Gammaproteobacteria bacterium]|nr:DNA repair protein RadC [Gammaproteobacteria bacterium]
MPIKDWPLGERPREKLLARGPRSLSDAELLAIFIRCGTRGQTALDLARNALSELGGLRSLLDCGQDRLCRLPGLGAAKFVELSASLELGRRYLESRLQRGQPLASPVDTRRYLESRLKGYPQEVFACLFLDNRHRVICFEEMFHGTIDGASVHPREVVRRALSHNAAAIIVSHNHPSGVAEPSRADRALTRRLQDAAALIDVRLLDHVVVGDGETVSFAERGWL